MVAAAVPLEVTVTDCVPMVPTATLPNESEVALKVSAGEPVAGEMIMSKYSVIPPDWAVMVAFWVIATLATLALNVALACTGVHRHLAWNRHIRVIARQGHVELASRRRCQVDRAGVGCRCAIGVA